MSKRKMKDSGVEWLGEIPAEWDVRRGKTFLRLLSRPVKVDDDIVTCFRDGEVTLRKHRREDGFTVALKECGYQGVEPGDLVVHGMDGFAGSIGISDSRGKASPVLNVLDTSEDKRYVMYYLRSLAMRDVFLALSTGIRVRSCDLRWSKLGDIQYLLPPLSTQRKIAAYLDTRCAKIDEMVSDAKKTIEEYKAWKASVIFESVTGKNTGAKMKDSGIDGVDLIPQNWRVCKAIRALSMPITDGPHTTPDLYDTGIPFVSAEAVSYGNGSIDFSHIRGFVSQEFYDECCKKYIPRRDDIYMIKSGATTGRVSIVDTDKVFTIWSPLAVFRANPDLALPRYLFYFLQSSAYQKQVEISWSYGTQQNIGMRVLEQLHVVLPPIEQQFRIIAELDKKCAAIDRVISEKESLIADLESYKKSLIFECVTGKMEVA